MRTWQQSETIPIKALCYDEDDALSSPNQGMLITITDPNGTEVITDTAISEESTGDFRYNYTLASSAPVGWWRYKVVAQNGTGANAVYVVSDEGFMVA